MSEAESSAQVELDSGKRVKVKAANILLKFEKPSPAELMREAQALAQTIELDLAWEFAPQEEFSFADLARRCCGHAPPALTTLTVWSVADCQRLASSSSTIVSSIKAMFVTGRRSAQHATTARRSR